VRAGCACYTTEDEIDRLIEGVQDLAQSPRSKVQEPQALVVQSNKL
jgi:hypothetical protein